MSGALRIAPRAALGLLLLAVAAGAQEPPVPEPPVEDPAPEVPAPQDSDGSTGTQEGPEPSMSDAEPVAPALDATRPASVGEILELVDHLAATHPDHAEARSLGTSRAGRALPLLVLGDRRGGDPDTRPGLVLLDATGPGGGETGLALATALLDAVAAGDAEAERLLRLRTVYVLPAADPDTRAADPGDRVVFERNFPVGWQPASVRPGSGAYPLSEPQTLAVAEFLASRGNVSLLLVGAPRPVRAESEAPVPAPDRRVFEALAARGDDPRRPLVLPWPVLGGAAGRVADYAYQELGMVSALLAPSAPPAEGPERAAWVRASAEVARSLVRELPRLVLGDARVERLRPGLYRVDVRCSNAGALPTLSALGAERHAAGAVELTASGATIVACAHRPKGRDAYDVDAAGESTFRLGQIDGGAGTELCLVVEAEEGAVLELVGRSERGGLARLAVTLQ